MILEFSKYRRLGMCFASNIGHIGFEVACLVSLECWDYGLLSLVVYNFTWFAVLSCGCLSFGLIGCSLVWVVVVWFGGIWFGLVGCSLVWFAVV